MFSLFLTCSINISYSCC